METKNTVNEKELEILKFWKEDKTFEKTLQKTKKGKPYIFYDGPPFATGTPHQGSLLGSITKDVFGRFHTMNGRYVRRVWGWDCHGLPIENLAEKDLKINSKDEIEKMGVKKFNDYCRSKVLGYATEWEKVIERVGRWVDMKNDYKTMDKEYIESVWWAFKQLHEKGYIYEGEKILMYCPRCSTPLAKAEIAMDNSYQNVKDSTVVVKFKLKDENVYALAWTTTPWTLPSNLALSVNPDLTYSYLTDVKDGTNYLLAKDLIQKFFKYEDDYTIIKEVKGSDLEGLEFEPLFPYFKDIKNAFKIILGDFVTAQDGTGIVHTAPAFGEEDYAVCRKYNIPMVQPVDEKGRFTYAVKDFEGKFIHDTNEDIIKFLKEQGKVVSVKKVSHEYPFCYRCDTKLMYRAIPAWFVDIQKIKPRLLELNKKLNWYPKFLKEGRVKYTIETAPDWNISRNRYWASAMPVWKNKKGEVLVIGSIEELKKYAKNLDEEKIDLHKDFLDKVILEKEGEKYSRVPEVLDCWFESGSMTFAQFHYPFENKKFFEDNFPADFVAEYIGQVRAWFYYMLVLSAIIFDDIPFQNVVTTGTILAEDGQKISKSKSNYTDPTILMQKYGADAFRFYLMSNPVMDADNLKFSDKQVEEVYKKLILITYNVNNFYKLYDSIEDKKLSPKNIIDKWIISRTNQAIKEVRENLENYNTIKASNEILKFLDELSTWYVRRTRERFNEDDNQAKATLKYALENFSKISAPIIPFTSEIVYQNINKNNISVHMQDSPKEEEKLIDEKLNKKMQEVREIVSSGLKERDKAQIGLKWPLAKAKINASTKLEKEFIEIIKEELNIKEIELFSSKTNEQISVELDTNITTELEAEGYAREITRKIQALRKTAGLVKEDEIELEIISEFNNLIQKHSDLIKEKVGAKIFSFKESKGQFNHYEEGKIKNKTYKIRLNKI